MNRLLTALLATFALCSAANTETLINLEEAAEVEDLRINIDGGSSAYIYARICDACELLKLRLDGNSRIRRGRQALGVADAAALRGKGATVLFNPQTLQITRILYWN